MGHRRRIANEGVPLLASPAVRIEYQAPQLDEPISGTRLTAPALAVSSRRPHATLIDVS
jgi:hypothetical protein